jgi:DNA polymerase III subunit beta
LREALLRAAVLSNDKVRAIRLQLRANFLHILANNPEQEEAEEILNVAYDGEDMEIAFNVTYMLDVLNTLAPGEIKLTFLDSNSRMFMEEMTNDNSLFLIMPLQI